MLRFYNSCQTTFVIFSQRWVTTLPSPPATVSPRTSPSGKVGNTPNYWGILIVGINIVEEPVFLLKFILQIFPFMKIGNNWKVSFWVFLLYLPFRCEVEEQVLGEINGNFTSWDGESDGSQVTLIQNAKQNLSHILTRLLTTVNMYILSNQCITSILVSSVYHNIRWFCKDKFLFAQCLNVQLNHVDQMNLLHCVVPDK